jgi:hypothetical protein
MTLQNLGAAAAHDEWAQIPDAQRVVHAVAQQKRAIRTDTQASDGIGVVLECIDNSFFAHVPDLIPSAISTTVNRYTKSITQANKR